VGFFFFETAGLSPAGEYRHPTEMTCKKGGSWLRPFGDVFLGSSGFSNPPVAGDVANSEEGVVSCAKRCGADGYKYFGLECPRQGTVHCQCAQSLVGSTKETASSCYTKNIAGSTHCVGPYKVPSWDLGLPS
jgi:hypothetical protein